MTSVLSLVTLKELVKYHQIFTKLYLLRKSSLSTCVQDKYMCVYLNNICEITISVHVHAICSQKFSITSTGTFQFNLCTCNILTQIQELTCACSILTHVQLQKLTCIHINRLTFQKHHKYWLFWEGRMMCSLLDAGRGDSVLQVCLGKLSDIPGWCWTLVLYSDLN